VTGVTHRAWAVLVVLVALASACGQLGQGGFLASADELGEWPEGFTLVSTDGGCGSGQRFECTRVWLLSPNGDLTPDPIEILRAHLKDQGWDVALRASGAYGACNGRECVSVGLDSSGVYRVHYTGNPAPG